MQNWLHVTEPGVSGPLVLFIWPRSQIGCKADGRKAIWHFKSYQYTNERAKLQRKTRRFQTWLSSSIAISKSDRTDCYLQKASFSSIVQSWFLYIRISEFNILSFTCGHQNLADCPCAKPIKPRFSWKKFMICCIWQNNKQTQSDYSEDYP